MDEQNPQTPQSSNQTNNDESFEQLKKELETTQQQLEDMTGLSKRALADLQNYKRRVEEEKSSFVTFANAALFKELLPAIENISRTLKHEPRDEEWMKGAEQTMKQILQICEKHGLKEIETTGQLFNPNMHEALLTASGEKDIIIEELEKGYILGDRVIKPARVKVGNGQ